MKRIIISIRPEWVACIFNGEKTVEIRKTAPKCELPIEVYIYCTKSQDYLLDKDERFFVWDKHEHHYLYKYCGEPHEHYFQGKVVAKFTLNKVEEVICRPICGEWESYTETLGYSEISQASCLKNREIVRYLRGKNGYAWHISDLQIFDEPKELSQFQKPGTHEKYLRLLEAARKDDLKLCEKYGFDPWAMHEDGVVANGEELTKEAYLMGAYGLQRAPQSWQYIEEEAE